SCLFYQGFYPVHLMQHKGYLLPAQDRQVSRPPAGRSQLGYDRHIFYARSFYTNNLTGSSNNDLNVCKKAAPVAPSTTRWSQLKVTFMIFPGTMAPFLTTGVSSIPPMAIMQASGGLMMAVNSSIPNMPRFD